MNLPRKKNKDGGHKSGLRRDQAQANRQNSGEARQPIPGIAGRRGSGPQESVGLSSFSFVRKNEKLGGRHGVRKKSRGCGEDYWRILKLMYLLHREREKKCVFSGGTEEGE